MGQITEYPLASAIVDSDTVIGNVGGATQQVPTSLLRGLAPAHEWSGTQVRFKNPDGTWGSFTDLKGATGLKGDAPAHEWSGTQLRFQNPDGSWGAFTDLKGATGATGAAGANGTAATIVVGTVTTLAAGSSATVTNAGTANAAVFNFGIPKGADGANGTGGGGGDITGYVDAYSTTEYKTNKFHTDGRPIYRKVIDAGTMPNNAIKTVTHSIAGIGSIITVRGNAVSGTDTRPLPYATNNPSWGMEAQADGTNVKLTTANDWSTYSAKVILEYTKTADSTGAIPTSILTTGGATGYVDAFSTTEYKTNKFHTDGKPVYRKQIAGGLLPNNASKTVAHSVSNIENVVACKGFATDGTTFIPLPHVNPQTAANGVLYFADKTNLTFITGAGGFTSFNTFGVIEYTKTTDAGGTIPATVDDTVYSTSETAIGKWINGKIIYRKVIDFGALPNTANKTVAHGISNISAVISEKAISHQTGNNWFPIPSAHPSNLAYAVFLDCTESGNISIRTGDDKSGYTDTKVILEYTCTDR